ncbi:MAG: hypothetical protein Athens101410_437 [Parcubacteria group bacterium Athens1014_10]|nr:MAG: hypothetical protein Athens101410_437 [Parcubacteria group bacterium Athens1014_10]TSD05516.1 MAG: hypothetical protein Athens071412_326 [Parcubacteria group bacterium Athens0714_12]
MQQKQEISNNGVKEEILKDLNQEQREAVCFDEGPFLIVAGAGTGKTTVITRRIAWLILNEKAKPEEILAVTFTDKAAEEMEIRIDQLLPYGYADLWISTFHSFCERVLKDYALEIGLPGDFKLLSQTEQSLLIRENFEKFNLDYYRPLGNPDKFIQALVKHFSRAKDEVISPEEYLNYAKSRKLDLDSKQSDELLNEEVRRLEEIANAYHTYQQILLENNALDFGDLINYTLQLFKKRPLVLEKFRKQFKYILVDEFQDTNYAQYELIKLLASPKNNLAVCFDDDQSIYKFRGASVSNVLQFKKDFPQSKDIVINKNYRSFQDILDLSYKFIQLNNPNRLEVQLAGKVTKKLNAQNKGVGVIAHLHCQTQEEEARKIAEKILELKKQGVKKIGSKPVKERLPEELKDSSSASWNDFAILVRANNQADIFCQVLDKIGAPYQFLASRGLYGKPVILDITAYLRLLDNYHESSALYRILNSPILNLNQENISLLNYWANRKNWSLYETLKNSSALKDISAEALKEINKLLFWIEKHTLLAKEKNITNVIFAFLEDTGYLKIISRKKDLENLENLNFLNQFFKKVEEYERLNKDKSLKDFRESLDLAMEMGDQGSLQKDFEETGPESIKIMTVHSAKGLEFKYVFIVNLVDRKFPTTERKEVIELPDALVKEIAPSGDIHLQEERRLFYVAMTRAKEGLFFTSAEDYGGLRKKKISRFLQELGFAAEDKKNSKALDFAEKFRAKDKISFAFQYPLPKRFSFTQIKAFETCPLQYKFAHILRVPVKGRFTFSFGKAMHSALSNFFQKLLTKGVQQELMPSFAKDTPLNKKGDEIKLPSLKELLEIYERRWIDDWYDNKKHQEDYKNKGKEILKNFYKELEKKMPKPRFLEIPFSFKLGQYTIKGAMDRVDEIENNKLEIIDYKTGSAPKTNLTLENKEQLLIYQLAGQEIFREKVGKLTFYYLEANKPFSFLGTGGELAEIKNKIMKIIEEIQKSDFHAAPNIQKCKFCDFKEICEYRAM